MDYVIADLAQQYQVALSKIGSYCVAVIDQLSGNRTRNIGFKDGVILMQETVASDPEATASWLAFRRELSRRALSLGPNADALAS